MDSQVKMKFPSICREMRVKHNLKQREVANAIGIKLSSYGNVESNNHKSVAIDRVHKIARFYALDEAATTELVAAWEELPASEYSQRQTKTFEQRRAFRSKAKNHDRLFVSLIELATLLITSCENPGALCTCEEPEPGALFELDEDTSCELCAALQLLGLSGGWTTREEVIEALAAAQEAMS